LRQKKVDESTCGAGVGCGEIQSKFESQKNVMRNNKIEDELIVPSIVQ